MTDHDTEVVAELVDDDHLPALPNTAAPALPTVDQHTILYPGQPIPTVDEQDLHQSRPLRLGTT